MDGYYTPARLATFLVSCCEGKPKSVADFAAGDGSLLRAARARWPNAQMTAFDLDGSAIAALATNFPDAALSKLDFLARDTNPSNGSKVDLVLLNPPFSMRGNASVAVKFDGLSFTMSRAMAFVTNALNWLTGEGELVAIVPSSCLTSQRDKLIREYLANSWKIERKRKDVANAFSHCDVNVDIIRIRRGQNRCTEVSEKKQRSRPRPYFATLMRGTCPNARAGSDGKFRVIHTTDLKNSLLLPGSRFIDDHSRKLKGKAVLLPRVGRPCSDKIVVKSNSDSIVLTDCVISLQTTPRGFEHDLASLLRMKWKKLEALYTGSCARYLTIDLLRQFLEAEGVTVSGAGGGDVRKDLYVNDARASDASASPWSALQ